MHILKFKQIAKNGLEFNLNCILEFCFFGLGVKNTHSGNEKRPPLYYKRHNETTDVCYKTELSHTRYVA